MKKLSGESKPKPWDEVHIGVQMRGPLSRWGEGVRLEATGTRCLQRQAWQHQVDRGPSSLCRSARRAGADTQHTAH